MQRRAKKEKKKIGAPHHAVIQTRSQIELIRLSGVDPDDVRRIKDGEIFGADGKELFEDTDKKIAAMRLLKLIASDGKPSENDRTERSTPENDLALLLRNKGISDDLIHKILSFGLTDETIRHVRVNL